MSQQFLPLLKPENIDELKSLILEIMEDNDSKLEKIIENRQNQTLQQGKQFSLQDLNDLLSEQCLQKQKIVSNLSHFALSLMNTIEVLWQDNQDLEYKIKDQRQVLEQMHNHLNDISKQGDFFKNKLNLAYNDLHKIEEQKHAIEEQLSSIIVKQDSSFCVKQRKTSEDSPNQKNFQDMIIEEQDVSKEKQFQNNFDNQNIRQSNGQEHICQQNLFNIYEKQRKMNHQYQMNLLQESIIKDSISVLRRFTLQDQVDKLPILEESDGNIKFIDKSNRFSLINQISLKIFQNPKPPQNDKQIQHSQSFNNVMYQERSIVRDLKISNEKVNITIGTGTQFTKTGDSDKHHQQFSMIQPSPSCASFLLQRQSSAIMYPTLERSNSTISFVTHTTKHIQTDAPTIIDKKINSKNVERKSIGIDTSTIISPDIKRKKPSSKTEVFTKEKDEIIHNISQGIKGEQNGNKKSFGQLLNYFTKKIVSDRIKTSNKKNDIGGFKKTKSNIQKVF